MFIKVELISLLNKQNKYLYKNIVAKKPIIIIPKKNVKLANKRNKIRRQIRAILKNNNSDYKKQIVVKYLDKNFKPSFEKLKQVILSNILKLKISDL